jgi:hypothetical protein
MAHRGIGSRERGPEAAKLRGYGTRHRNSQFAIDSSGFVAICTGLALLIGAAASFVWACRRDPRGPASSAARRRLPPAE